jgi:hypothetical protein
VAVGEVVPCPGGVIVMVCAVNSSSKYRVSVSEVTCGLKGGTSCERREDIMEHIGTSVLSESVDICRPGQIYWLFSEVMESVTPIYLLLINILPFNPSKEFVLHDLFSIILSTT